MPLMAMIEDAWLLGEDFAEVVEFVLGSSAYTWCPIMTVGIEAG
jgi:hypothetical protein